MSQPIVNYDATAGSTRGGWSRPWRSAKFGWVVACLALIGGIPLFLCMPPWADVTLYDVATRNIIRGGVHYRDVFDTNLPGVVWVMACIRSTCGWSYEALRAWDLVFVGGAAGVLGFWARRNGASNAAVAWYAVAVALFYPFTSEFNHCQRDPWMLLPAVLASWLRVNRVRRIVNLKRGYVWSGIAEGILWGLAIWLKPHVLIPALCVWLLSAVVVYRLAGVRAVVIDGTSLLFGGLFAGGLGLYWLVATGTWPYFWDVFTRWNPEYMSEVWRGSELLERISWELAFFPPWSLMHLMALPVAVLEIRTVFRRSSQFADLVVSRGSLAALYLGWMIQALVFQRGFDYVHVPETLLAMALLASRSWSVGFPYLVWFVVVAVLIAFLETVDTKASESIRAFNKANRFVKLENHPLADRTIIGLWPRCCLEGSTFELRDQLAQHRLVHCATKWSDLDNVVEYLRSIEPRIQNRELTCWHDSTHPLYLMLDVDPSTRYMHYGTVFPLRGKLDEIRRAVASSPQRYVVSDLLRMSWDGDRVSDPGAAGPNSLPSWFPKSQRGLFPWNQPVVFRSGRYVVHRIAFPPQVEEIDIPDWNHLDELGPGD